MTSPPDAAALIPAGWRDQVSRLPSDGGPTGADWAVGLPRLLAQTLDEWDLRPVGPARTGCTAIVVPVKRDGTRLALKLVWPHTDGAGEPLALRLWDGNGSVHLIAANPGRGVLLLEWLDPARDLEDPAVDIDTACEIIGQLLHRLHVPAPPNVRSLAVFLDEHLHGARGLTRAGDHLPAAPSIERSTWPRTCSPRTTRRPPWCTATCTSATSWPPTASRGWRSTRSRWPVILASSSSLCSATG